MITGVQINGRVKFSSVENVFVFLKFWNVKVHQVGKNEEVKCVGSSISASNTLSE